MPHQPQHRPSEAETTSLTEEIALYCRDESGRTLSFWARFGYRAQDPYAVAVTFHVPGGEVRWVLGRDLLERGLCEAAGSGDVVVRPGPEDRVHAATTLEFRSPGGRLAAEARTSDLLGFLLRTWAVVEPGCEGEHVDLDVLVADLLAG